MALRSRAMQKNGSRAQALCVERFFLRPFSLLLSFGKAKESKSKVMKIKK
jgi:hypothetical protein